jgi:colicin import membrane protein
MKKSLIITILLAVVLASYAYQSKSTAYNPTEQTQQKQPNKSKAKKYASKIQKQITKNWYRPSSAQPGLRCRLRITQQPGGEVISAAIVGSCNGDEATRRSMIEAVERAGPLPYRGFEDVFEQVIDFEFTYEE